MDWIGWDERKRQINIDKHGYDFGELDVAFFETATHMPARGGRRRAVSDFKGTLVTVVFQPLGAEGVSVISMRHSSSAERKKR
jgi:uncharacterized DUF497 family protein